MKAKQSIWKNKLAKTTILATTLVVVFTMIFGSAATAIQNVPLRNEIDQNTQPMTETELSLGVDKTPYTSAGPAPQSNAIWDLQLNIDVDTPTGTLYAAGAECDGTYLYVSEFSTSAPYGFYKFTMTGAFVGGFSISGAGTIRDLAYDGQYMYGGAGSTTIYKMDFTSGTLVGTFSSPAAVRAIAYDPVFDAFWVSDWTSAITLVSRAGVALQTIPHPSALAGKYGFAYDANTAGGPFLWIFDQTTGATNTIHQMLLSSGTLTGVSHNCDPDLGNAGMAGGLFATDTIVAGKFSVGGLSQGTPDKLFAYEISNVVPKDHDVAVMSIDAPVAGPAAASIVPKATVKNLGIYTENFNVSLKIFEELTGSFPPLYQQGFESYVPMVLGTMPPAGGWGIQNKNGYGTWLRDFSKANSRSGYYNAYIRNDTTQNSDVLHVKPIYIPVNNLSYSFYYKVWLNGAPETFKIGYWTGIELDWIWVDQVTTTVGTTWTKYTWNIPTNLTGSTVYFAINYTSNDWYGMRLDDFTLPDGSTEGFEDTMGYFTGTPNWVTVQTAGTNYNNYWLMGNNASAVMVDHNPFTGAQMAWFDIRGRCQSPDASRLRMQTPISLASYGQELLNMNFYLWQTSQGSSYQDKVALDISTDNGATWKQLGEWRQYSASAPSGGAWYKISASLSGYEDETSVLFGFRASAGSSSASGFDITIDNVTITYTPINVLVSEVKPVVGLAAGASTQVSFTAWTVPGWQSGLPQYSNTNVKYNVKVKALLPTDVYLKNNVAKSSPLLYYPYLHDVGITAIVQPSTGPAGSSIPVSYTIKNFGQFPENGAASWFFSNISIKEIPGTIAINEDFSDSIPKPEAYGDGWAEQLVSGTATVGFSCRFSGYYPSGVLPINPPMMLEYNSFSISSGGSSRMISEPLNLTGVGEVRLKFYMYHDSGYATSADRIQWQYSTDGTTWTNFAGGLFYRSSTLQGVTPSTWVEWKVDASAITNMSNVRLGILATSAYGNDIMLDNARLTKLSDGTVWKQYTFNTYTPAYVDFNPADGFTVQKTDAYGYWSVYGTTPTSYAAKCYEIDSYGAQDEWLITRNLTTGSDTWLKFYRYFYRGGSYPDSTAYVLASADGGATWPYTLYTWTSSQTSPTIVETQLPSWANNQNDLRIAFRFVSGPDAQPTSTYKADYLRIDDLLVSDKATFLDYMSPYVPPVVLNPGDSVTVTPVNWVPSHTASGIVSYQAVAQTWLTTDNNTGNNNLAKSFTLTFGHDLAVTAITQPNVAWIAGAAQPVAATIKNMGTFTESKTATATITDLGSSTIVYTSTYNIVGLTSGTEITATFDPFTPTASGNYKLRVEVPADDVAANDYKEFSFGVDLTAPVSTHTVNPASPNGQNGWYVSDVTVTLSSTDTGCGVDAIFYKIGTGTWNEYSGAITLSSDGSYDIKYKAVDKLGNTEAEKTIPTIKIDKTKPTITLSVNALNAMKTKWLLSASVSDATSGIAKVEFYIADALIGTVTAAPWEYIYSGTDGPAQAIVYDNAGNSEVSEEVASFVSELTNNVQQTRPFVNSYEL